MALFGRRAVIQVEDRRLEDLRVTFDVLRNLRNVPSSAELKVYNLAESTRRALAARTEAREQIRVLLLCGYRDETPHQVFAGTLRRLSTRREGGDVVTSISSGDGTPKSLRVSGSFAGGVDLAAVLGNVARQAVAGGLKAGNVAQVQRRLTGRTVGAGGLVLSGSLDVALSTILDQVGIEWSVQDGALQLLERGTAVQTRAVVLSPDTGLVDSPELLERGRVRARSLIAPGLAPGLLVRLESLLITGFYRVESARYSGDTEGAEWHIELELSPARAA